MAKVIKKRSSQVFLIAVVLLVSGASLYIYQQKFPPKGTVTTQTDKQDEQELIMAAAKGGNTTNEINGIEVTYVFGKQIGDYALVRAVPLNNETDPLQIILQKVNGKWQVIDSGTSFPELEDKLPTGFFE